MLESVMVGQLQDFCRVVEKMGRHVSSCPDESTQALLTTNSTCVYYNDVAWNTQCIECRPGTRMVIEAERGWGLPLCELHSSFMIPEITIGPGFATIPLSSSGHMAPARRVAATEDCSEGNTPHRRSSRVVEPRRPLSASGTPSHRVRRAPSEGSRPAGESPRASSEIPVSRRP
jgi:hypothetical protein